jgi:hypothetical protein
MGRMRRIVMPYPFDPPHPAYPFSKVDQPTLFIDRPLGDWADRAHWMVPGGPLILPNRRHRA